MSNLQSKKDYLLKMLQSQPCRTWASATKIKGTPRLLTSKLITPTCYLRISTGGMGPPIFPTKFHHRIESKSKLSTVIWTHIKNLFWARADLLRSKNKILATRIPTCLHCWGNLTNQRNQENYLLWKTSKFLKLFRTRRNHRYLSWNKIHSRIETFQSNNRLL